VVLCSQSQRTDNVDARDDRSLKKRLGVNRLRRYLLEMTWKKHKELIPQIPTLIDTLSKKTADRRVP
jgi:hypothetical protein